MRLSDNKYAKKFSDKFPIITSRLPDWQNINPPLEQGIRLSGDKQNHSTNVKADMTDFQMWEQDKPAYQQFQILCQYAVDLAFANAPEQSKPHFKPVITEIWGAVYKKGEHTNLHDHWPATWSFTYYVNVSDNCSPIVFPDARISLKPKNGMMCMFPGWVGHRVPKQSCDHERVMVAGNISHKP